MSHNKWNHMYPVSSIPGYFNHCHCRESHINEKVRQKQDGMIIIMIKLSLPIVSKASSITYIVYWNEYNLKPFRNHILSYTVHFRICSFIKIVAYGRIFICSHKCLCPAPCSLLAFFQKFSYFISNIASHPL